MSMYSSLAFPKLADKRTGMLCGLRSLTHLDSVSSLIRQEMATHGYTAAGPELYRIRYIVDAILMDRMIAAA